MQFDIDMIGEFSEIFIKVRDIVLSYKEIKEIKNAKQTSYRDALGVVVMMRGKVDTFVLAFGKGAVLQKRYPFLQGDGSIVRHWNLYKIFDLNEGLLREIIEESMILNIEYCELKKLKGKR